MFGAVIREYYRNPEINQGKKLVSVSIMPCTAKKEEILRPESMTNGRQDVDYVLTTTEVASMIRKSGIRFENIDGESTDMPFGIGSGGGVIFGVTGGVTEAVLTVSDAVLAAADETESLATTTAALTVVNATVQRG